MPLGRRILLLQASGATVLPFRPFLATIAAMLISRFSSPRGITIGQAIDTSIISLC